MGIALLHAKAPCLRARSRTAWRRHSAYRIPGRLMKVLYFHQHFSTPSGSVGIRSYGMVRKLIALKHEVVMVCGSYKGGATGLTTPFVDGVRRGIVDGIGIIEFDLAYSNSDGFV